MKMKIPISSTNLLEAIRISKFYSWKGVASLGRTNLATCPKSRPSKSCMSYEVQGRHASNPQGNVKIPTESMKIVKL